MEFTVPLDVPFNLEFTLQSGQVFRWEKRGAHWYGVVNGTILKVAQEMDVLRCTSGSDRVDSVFTARYFRLDDELAEVLASLSTDEPLAKAAERFYGLRLVRQDQWECLASFLLATNANIPRIKKMVSAVCEKYGRPFQFEGATFYSFPSAETLASARTSGLAACGLGYRASFLRKVAESVADGKFDFHRLTGLGYEESQKMLLAELFGEKVLLGVGPKVADCFLLYSCDKDESFPIDVWIARALARYYPGILGPRLRKRYAKDGRLRLTPGEYASLSKAARGRFGEYAGYAQQYLYMMAREG